MRAAIFLLTACSVSNPSASRPEPLAPLPGPGPVETQRFRDAETCGQCHLADETTPVLHDGTGANVAPVLLWRSSLMALAARDPYYLAVFAEELAKAPANKDSIETLCTRCHSPAASEELASSHQHITFDDLTASTAPEALLARGGVTCTLCHQIEPGNLGEESSFSGGFKTGYQRKIYGRYLNPVTDPMQLIVNYTPTLGTHIEDSGLCATCHTVMVGDVLEQATYLEWRSSTYAPMQPCQSCHVPTVDSANHAISTQISRFPQGLGVRQPVGKHVFVGGNSYVLSLLADAVDWSGANIPAAELTASAARDDEHLRTAARLSVADVHREGTTLVVTVRVENKTGHKLPTGYPSRRMWLHVTAGSFESGEDPAPGQPHRDTISSAGEAQVWEAVLVDASGKPTHRALDAKRYGKDDRILPAGFAPSTADRVRTNPVGTDGDPSFVAGRDDVTYRIDGVAVGAQITIELLFESTHMDIVEAIDSSNTPAATRFVDMARAHPITPVVMATLSASAP